MQKQLRKTLAVALTLLMLCTLLPWSAVIAATEDASSVLSLDFEDGRIGLTVGSGTSIVSDSTLGSHCLKWDSVGGYDSIYTTTTLKPNTDYVVRFKMKSNMTNQLQIVVQKTDWSQYLSERVIPTTDWADYAVVINSADYTDVMFKFQSLNGSGTAQTFWFDDLTVSEKGDEPEPEPEPEEPVAENMLVNGGFETGNLNGWENLWNNNTVTLVKGHTGSHAIHVISGQWKHVRQFVDVKPNTDYVVTIWAKEVNNMTLLIKDGADTTNVKQIPIAGNGSTWEMTTLEFNSGDYTQLILTIMGNVAESVGTFDDVCMTEKKIAATDGYIENGDFETGQAAPWATYQTTAVSATAKYEGNYGMKLAGSGTNYGGLLNQTIYGLKVGVTYNLSLMLKVVKDGVNVQVTSGSDRLTSAYYATNNAGSWTTVTLPFTAISTEAVLNFCGSGNNTAVEAYVDNVTCARLGGEIHLEQAIAFGGASIRDQDSSDGTGRGLAFRFDIDAVDGVKDYENKYVRSSAKIVLDGKQYTLVRMGAVVTNLAAVGQSTTDFTLDAVNGTKIIDVPAVYLNKLTADSVSFAVRILDIPDRHVDSEIYARPYFVCLQDGQEITVYGDIHSDNYHHVADPKSSIKILSIGHSYSKDVMETYLWNMFKSGGYDEVVIGYLYIAACPMPQHLSNVEKNAAAYEYSKNSNGTWTKKYNQTALSALQDEEWDYVTLQSSPGYVGGQTVSDYAKTEYECITPLTDWIRANAKKSNVKVDYHMIWAFSEGCDTWSYMFHNYNQLTMYNNIITQTKQHVVGHEAIYNIIPCATSIQNGRTSFIGDNFNEPDATQGGSDGYHLNNKYGDYTAALTWYCLYSGDDATAMAGYKGQLSAQEFAAIAEAVNNAIDTPFAITASTYQ